MQVVRSGRLRLLLRSTPDKGEVFELEAQCWSTTNDEVDVGWALFEDLDSDDEDAAQVLLIYAVRATMAITRTS